MNTNTNNNMKPRLGLRRLRPERAVTRPEREGALPEAACI